MSDIERDLEDIGRQVWQHPEQVLRRVRSGARERRGGRALRFGRPLGALLGIALAIVVIGGVSAAGIVALQHHLVGTSSGADKNAVPASNGGGHGAHSGLAITTASSSPVASAGISPAARVSASPGSTAHPGPVGGTLLVTANSRGTYEVKVGTTVIVDLSGDNGNPGWSMPSSTPVQVVRFQRGSRSASNGISAVFVAAATGKATIQAAQSSRCPPLCGPPSYLWRIEIIVVA